jgi:aspartyl-tRNA(Asn)/glutamyl-tRNA(Gln) amidotransferase subunit A
MLDSLASLRNSKFSTSSLKKNIIDNISLLSSPSRVSGYVDELKSLSLQSVDSPGIPIAIKNNINVKGWSIDCSSKILHNYISPFNATVIDNLISNGFTPFGVCNMDEFAMGSTTATSIHGKTTNPSNPDLVPGGSSGGSAAVVAEGSAFCSLGTDTGGSIRQPAAFTGTVGFKPSYGHVSRYGVIAYASSLDQVGPITKSVTDNAIVYDAIKGYDPKDSTSLDIDYPSTFDNLDPNKKYTIAVISEYIDLCEPELRDSILDTVDLLEKNGHSIIFKKLFDTDLLISSYYTIASAEASSNLSRFDGVKFGYRSPDSSSLDSLYVNSRSDGFGDVVSKRIMLGSFVLSSGYYDAFYKKAKNVQSFISSEFDSIFSECDLILMPVAPTTAFRFDSSLSDLDMFLNDIFTISVNLAGLPAMSVPLRNTSFGSPTALQLISNSSSEQNIFNLALSIESSLTPK